MSNSERVSRVFKYELVGGPGAQAITALNFVSVINYRLSESETASVPNKAELDQQEKTAYVAALDFLTNLWQSPTPDVKQLITETRYQRSTCSLDDVVTKSIEMAVQEHTGRNGFFTLDVFSNCLAKLSSSAPPSRELAESLLISRNDVQRVDGGLFSFES